MKAIKINQKITTRENSSFKQYLKEVNEIPMLTPKEESELAERAVSGDKLASEELVTRNLRFVISVAKQYATDKIPLEDLVNEGNIGLIKAVEKFDPTRGYKFISFAVWWVRKFIMEYVSNYGKTIRIPSNRINELSKLNKYISAVEQKTSHRADIEEVISQFSKEMPADDFCFLDSLNSFTIDSMDRQVTNEEGNGTSISDLMCDEDANKTDYLLDDSDVKTEINSALATLKPRNKKIMEMLFGINGYQPMTLQEVGDEIGLTREMIRQIKDKSLKQMAKIKRIQIVAQS
jgi:RNA polymerase primary sigma factor